MHDLVQIGLTTTETLDIKVLEGAAELKTRDLLDGNGLVDIQVKVQLATERIVTQR